MLKLLNEDSELYYQPKNADITLKKHQLAMLKRCITIESIPNNNYGIMNDKPGTGKTYVILGLIAETLQENSTNIIIVPQNIYSQWCISIEKFSKKITYKKFINYDNIIQLYTKPEILYESNIILTTSSYYHIISTTLASLNININRVFFDEIDSISNIITTNINTNFLWFVSASFDKDSLGYFKIDDSNINDITCKCDDGFIDSNIYLESPIKKYYLCKNIYIDNILENVISEKELLGLNAMDYTLHNKDFEKMKAKNEKDVIEIILQSRKSIIKFDESQIDDSKKNIIIYNKFKNNKILNEEEYKKNIDSINIIYDFKECILNVTSDFDTITKSYVNLIINDYKDGEKIIREERNDEIKSLKSILDSVIELLYNMNDIDKICNEYYIRKTNSASIDNLKVNLKTLIILIDDIYKIVFKINDENIVESIDFYDSVINIKDYINSLNSSLLNFEQSQKAENQLNIYNKIIEICSKNIEDNQKKINLIYERLMENNCCTVCYDDFVEKYDKKIYITSTCCNNKVCEDCINNWYSRDKNSCIFCNSENKSKDDHLFFEKNEKNMNNNDNNHDNNENVECVLEIEKYSNNKNIFLKEFIENIDKKSKVIIFSDYSHIFHYIIDICNKYDIKHVDLDKGNIKDIDNVVNEYKYGNAQILLSNSTLFGCGMNFENSSHILFVHKMESEIEKQVIGRAQRMGRKSVLEIIYLQHENELDYTKKNKSNYINNYELNKSDELEGYYNEQQYYNLIENIQHFNFDEINHLTSNISNNEILDLDLETQCTEINNFIDLHQMHGEYIDVNLEELITNLY
jgi:hypothetical protein